MVRPRQHTFRLSTRQPSKVELDPLSIQVRAHINVMVARGMYAHIFYTVLKWTVTDSQIPAWRGLFLQNNASQTLLCTHIAQGSRFTAPLGRGLGVSISNTFRDDAKATGPWTTLRGYAVHVGRKSAGKSPTMQPPEQGGEGKREPGGWGRLTLPECFSNLPEHCNRVGKLKSTDARLPPWEMLISFAWGVAWAYVVSEAPQGAYCAELWITALVVDANGLKY